MFSFVWDCLLLKFRCCLSLCDVFCSIPSLSLQVIRESSDRLLALGEEWEVHRVPLIERVHRLRLELQVYIFLLSPVSRFFFPFLLPFSSFPFIFFSLLFSLLLHHQLAWNQQDRKAAVETKVQQIKSMRTDFKSMKVQIKEKEGTLQRVQAGSSPLFFSFLFCVSLLLSFFCWAIFHLFPCGFFLSLLLLLCWQTNKQNIRLGQAARVGQSTSLCSTHHGYCEESRETEGWYCCCIVRY